MKAFFKSLAQNVLTTFSIRNKSKSRNKQVIANQRLAARKKSETPFDEEFLIIGDLIVFPLFNVMLHGDLRRHPIVCATRQE
jgi:hypothetical protein